MDFSEMGTLATGLYDFEGVREDNLPFKKGEVITIIEMSDSGWWKGANSAGRVGIFPYNYVQARESTPESSTEYRIVKAIADCFEVPSSDYLQFKAGDLITILKPVNDDWSIGKIYADPEDPESETKEGKFPLNFVEETGEVDDKAAGEEDEKFARLEQQKLKEAEQLQAARKELEEKHRQQQLEQQHQREEREKKLKEIEEEQKARVKQLAEEEAERRKTEIDRKKTMEQNMMNKLKEALAEQEEKMKEIEKQKEELEKRDAERREEQRKLQKEAEAARKRAEQAEQELQYARAEQERLRRIQQEKDAANSAEVARQAQLEKLKIQEKANKSYLKFTQDDGFLSPPPPPEESKDEENDAPNGQVRLSFDLEPDGSERSDKSLNIPETDSSITKPPQQDSSITKPPQVNSSITKPPRQNSVQTPAKKSNPKKSEEKKLSPHEQMELARQSFKEMTSGPKDKTPNKEEEKNGVRFSVNKWRKSKVRVPSKFSKLGGAVDKCKKCNKGVGFGPDSLKALDAVWHRTCFTCATCSKVLRQGEWVDNKGFPYCQRCHKAGFGIKGFGFGGIIAGNYK